jgi:hypothetical protein
MLGCKKQKLGFFACAPVIAASLLVAGAIFGCSSSTEPSGGTAPDVHDLTKGGKADGMSLAFTLTDDGPTARLRVRCDQPDGCDGYIFVDVLSPNACEILGVDASQCAPGMDPAESTVATLNLQSLTEGERELPLRIETGDGIYFSTSVSAAFAATAGETVSFVLTKTPGAPLLEVEVAADWQPVRRPDPTAAELEAYLSTVEGLAYWETSTAYAGYRSYVLDFTQPLDHNDEGAGVFRQRMVLHHRDRSAPMVLYTSGYQLFTQDYLAELAEVLPANQISTEQRFFGTSFPDDFTTESWKHVNIEQAAKDHHRVVEALRPFYEGKWISTGHSKGGMTSIYHRRFFPNDVDATVAYVAPISFGAPDPRYEDFLDQIGTDSCRELLRDLQRAALERFDVLQPKAEADAAYWGSKFEQAGGHAQAFEYAITQLDWGFWQGQGVDQCAWIPPVEGMSDDDLYYQVVSRVGHGAGDDGCENAYNYQASTQLGFQTFSTRAFGDLLPFGGQPRFCAPAGADRTYDPSVMQDVQAWVLEEGSEILFLYGEYDPWTGGRFATYPSERVVDVTAPEANHGAMIKSLTEDDRKTALGALEAWTGLRATVAPQWQPSHAPMPPRILHHGLGRPALAPQQR